MPRKSGETCPRHAYSGNIPAGIFSRDNAKALFTACKINGGNMDPVNQAKYPKINPRK
jgi:hypothetical protein